MDSVFFVGLEEFLPSILEVKVEISTGLLLYLAQKILNALFYVALALLAFPTAKGVRRFLRELISFLSKKADRG